MANCPQCGATVDPGLNQCRYCGEPLQAAPLVAQQPYAQPAYQQQPVYSGLDDGVDPAWPLRNKVVAGVLAIFLGGFGIHKFYLGKIGLGLLYLVLCWTYIPAVVGFIEGIVYLASTDRNFQLKNKVRLF